MQTAENQPTAHQTPRQLSWQMAGQKYLRLVPLIEAVFSLLMIAAAFPYLANFVKTMATTSLWNDELYSIVHFSGRGPFTTLTDYHVPNNHIFFNLLNSLTPGAGSFDPLRARLWSFLSIGGLLGLILYEFFRRKQFLAGALIFQVIAVNYELLDLSLQGRGYGILAFCGMGIGLALWRYFEKPGKGWLGAISALSIVGSLTVPTFIFFSGTALLLLFLFNRKREIFITGLITAGIIVLAYLPVAGEVIHQNQVFADQNGREYETASAIFTNLKQYLFHIYVWGIKFKDWAVFAALASLFLLPLLTPLRHQNSSEIKTVRLLAGAIAGFFTLCLLLETVLIRTTAFIGLPIFFCFVLMGGFFFYQPRLNWLRPLVASAVAIYFSLHSLELLNNFHFTPVENWLGTARYIERTFPKGTEVYITTSGTEYLSSYLSQAYPLTTTFDAQKFGEGRTVVVDARALGNSRFNPTQYSALSTEVFIFQRWNGYQKVMVTPPPAPDILRVEAEGKTLNRETFDRDNKTRWTASTSQTKLRVYLKPGTNYRSFYLLTGKEVVPTDLQAELGLAGGSVERLSAAAIGKHREMVTLFLDNRAVEYLDLSVSESKNFAIIEMWAYQS